MSSTCTPPPTTHTEGHHKQEGNRHDAETPDMSRDIYAFLRFPSQRPPCFCTCSSSPRCPFTTAIRNSPASPVGKMGGSQLTQLKTALNSAGLNRKQSSKKDKKAFKKGGAREVDRVKTLAKLEDIRKNLNKFDERETKVSSPSITQRGNFC